MYQYKAKLLNVVDGDTIDMAVDMGFSVTIKQRLRLRGINTPELNSTDPVQRALAVEAKQFVLDTLKIGETYVIDTYKGDKYGRLLADVHVTTAFGEVLTLSKLLIENGLAKEYLK